MSAPRFLEIAHATSAYWASVALRDAVLRRPLGLAFSAAELASETDSHHLVGYLGAELCGCLILAPVNHATSTSAPATPLAAAALKMRQVAVAPAQQRRGIGERLIRFSEAFALERGVELIQLHARAVVVPFYERLGYVCTSDVFEEVGLPHRAMQKALGPAR